MTIGFTGGSVSGYKYAGLISKTSTGSWTGSTWHPPLSAKSVTNICKGKWVPSAGGGEGEGGETPPVLYCTAINKGKFPDKIEFVKPAEDKNIAPGDSVSLEITVKDQDGKAVSGHTINWSVNQTGTYFSLAGGTGYTQEVSSSAATPPGTSCTVKATIKDTTISATSKKITVFGIKIVIDKKPGFRTKKIENGFLDIWLYRAHIYAESIPKGLDISGYHLQQNAYLSGIKATGKPFSVKFEPDGTLINIPADKGYYDTVDGPTGPGGYFALEFFQTFDCTLKVFVMELPTISKTWGYNWAWDEENQELTAHDKGS